MNQFGLFHQALHLRVQGLPARLLAPTQAFDFEPFALGWMTTYGGHQKRLEDWFGSHAARYVRFSPEIGNLPDDTTVVQRGGICDLETNAMRQLHQVAKNGGVPLVAAIDWIERQPTLTQLFGWTLLPHPEIPSVVFHEDNLFVERWDQLTFGRGRALEAAFTEQLERTDVVLLRWARLLLGKPTEGGWVPFEGAIPVVFVRFSAIWEVLTQRAEEWRQQLSEHLGDDIPTSNNVPIIFTYLGIPSLLEMLCVPQPETATWVLNRQLSHCRFEDGWKGHSDDRLRMLYAAVTKWIADNPPGQKGVFQGLRMAGYLDHHGPTKTGLCYADARGDDVLCWGNRVSWFIQQMRPQLNEPFPLIDNRVFQNALVLVFIPEVFGAVQRLMALEDLFGLSDRVDKRQWKARAQGELEFLAEQIERYLRPLFADITREELAEVAQLQWRTGPLPWET